MTRTFWLAATVALCVVSPALAELPVQRLEIDTASGPHMFKVELASTEAERATGLMNRRVMAKDRGMLFDFHTQQPVIFWMKDTYIPLDMIFVSQDGHVVSVKHDAKPLDESMIPSGGPALGVVELNAGVADAIGVKAGDTVKHPMFNNVAAKPAH